MDSKLKGRIIVSLRRLTYSYKPRNDAKNRCKVAPATFKCELCQIHVYAGTSKETPKSILSRFPDVIQGKINLDHKEPVICPKTPGWDWNVFIERLFCDIKGFQVLCEKCHKGKTLLENQLRKDVRNSK